MKNIMDVLYRFLNPLRTRKVLVIDDSEPDRTFVVRALSSRYNVITAPGGREGIDMAVKERPDLIILDFMMPGMNGPEVCRRIRADKRVGNVPVIFLTSLETPHAVVEGLEQEADAYLTKPIGMRDLIEEVNLRIKGTERDQDA